MKHLTPADYIRQPWKNGKGVTVELSRADRIGAMLWRLSMATVAEDGPFSVFPGIDRNLTVLDGPGFRLLGEGIDLPCPPLSPVAFAGDVAVRAVETGGQTSTDFNVMTSRQWLRSEVEVATSPRDLAAADMTAVFALGRAEVNGKAMARHHLILTEAACQVTMTEPVLIVRLTLR